MSIPIELTLATLNNGDLLECATQELRKICQNIADPNVKTDAKRKLNLKPRVDLAPYRTFPEVAQPVSSFVFRARCPEASQPMLMLVEADGGRWKVEAMNTLREAMGSWDLNIPIIT
jgi:hypothetical protein